MLTSEDIQLIISAEKEVFPSKEDFEDLRKDFRTLQTSVDKLATILQKYFDEQKVLVHKVQRMEDWIKKASTKLGIDFSL